MFVVSSRDSLVGGCEEGPRNRSESFYTVNEGMKDTLEAELDYTHSLGEVISAQISH
ncbi:hypothetical protein [Halobacillus sp. H74]|uniref:hypothetical protein n=1 Tax=Halobacillus sp. H74 TaxID=3457436 RepID=UPI003FCCC65B